MSPAWIVASRNKFSMRTERRLAATGKKAQLHPTNDLAIESLGVGTGERKRLYNRTVWVSAGSSDMF